jgi:predicted metal-dependent hydrolase
LKGRRTRVFAISKIGWIRQQQAKLRGQERESLREYLERVSHYQWGKRYLLKVIEQETAQKVELQAGKLSLFIRLGADEAIKEKVVSKWYGQLSNAEVRPLIDTWESRLQVSVIGVSVRRMKTKRVAATLLPALSDSISSWKRSLNSACSTSLFTSLSTSSNDATITYFFR